MSMAKKALILFVAAVLVLSGYFFLESNYLSPQYIGSSPQAAASTVYIENGVSGVVTLTDPFQNKTVNIDVSSAMDSGSGVTVTRDGYVITAFHVVSDPNALDQNSLKKMESGDVERYVEEAAVKEYLAHGNSQLGSLLNQSVDGSYSAGSDDVSALTETLRQKNLLSVRSSQQLIKVKFSSSVNGGASYSARLVDVGNPSTDDDVAILKVDSAGTNLPTLNISSKEPGTGENVRIYGYPNSDSYGTYQTDNSSPQSTSGSLKAQTFSSGTVYYRTSAPTAEGYSGGPVLNNQSDVVGILVYGSKSSNSRGTKAESGIFLSSNYIIKLCNKNNVSINVV